jgi:PAB1-binding protein PBP1
LNNNAEPTAATPSAQKRKAVEKTTSMQISKKHKESKNQGVKDQENTPTTTTATQESTAVRKRKMDNSGELLVVKTHHYL